MKKWPSLLPVLALGAGLLLAPQRAASAAQEALALCLRSVLPSLFPFFVVTGLLVRLGLASALQGLFSPLMGPLFHMRGVCALPLLTGLLGGYPTGAGTAARLHGDGALSRQEAELLLGFCNNCGPSFILGYVAGVLDSPRAGVLLYVIHVLSALLTGVVLCRLCRDRGPALLPCSLPRVPPSFPAAFTASVAEALSSGLSICAYVVLFRVIAALLPTGFPPQAVGALEMVSGISSLSPGRRGFLLAAGVLGWGGLCVHCQTMAAAEGLRLRWHWMGKALQGILSVLLAAALSG